MNSRRKFLQQAAALSVGGAIVSNSSWANLFTTKIKIPAPGIQLFSVLREMDTDPVGTLEKIAAAGYKNIESAFKKPTALKGIIHDMGMEWRSHHVVGSPIKLPPNYKMPTGPDGKPISFPAMMTLKDNSQE